MKLYCANGCTPPYKTRSFQRDPDEVICPNPGCGGRLETGMERNAKAKVRSRSGGLHDVSSAAHFSNIVRSWPCWAAKNRQGHSCWGRVDPHHLVPADWIRTTYGDLPESGLLRILFNPLLGAPLCRGFHEAIERRSEVIHFEELDPELVEFAEHVDDTYPGLPSMLARLELESPRREAAA